ncbi:PREDICTED: defensin-like protein 266, partial [Camelina sativa]
KMKDVTIQRGGSCNNDNTCHDTCPGCKNTQCIFSQCVCSQCNTPRTSLRVESHM